MKGYCKEPYALIGHVRFCEERKLEVKGGKYRMTKTIIKQQQNAETLVALYIYIDTFTDKWNSFTRPHTHLCFSK